MGLGAALVDQARIVKKASTGVRTEGTTKVMPVTGAWFKARLTLPDANEDAQDNRARVRTVTRPQLLYALKDSAGEQIVLTNEQRLEVDSQGQGRAVWEIAGDPQPIRKKRRLIGHTAQLARVEEHQATLQ